MLSYPSDYYHAIYSASCHSDPLSLVVDKPIVGGKRGMTWLNNLSYENAAQIKAKMTRLGVWVAYSVPEREVWVLKSADTVIKTS